MSKTKDNGPTARTARAETMRTADIDPAPYNVHGCERKGDETFQGLVASVRANGIIHRIVVRPSPGKKGRWIIVDGHRRFEAAKAAGLDEVPVEVRDIGEAEALAVTVAANVQRLDDDPLLEAEAIERMVGAGMTHREIAAAIGKGEGYVARRARLVSLAEPWREFARRIRCTVDMLERIAAHDAAVQERVAADAGLDEHEEDGGDPCGWSEFESAFSREMRLLDEAPFDVAACAECPKNTACHRWLFDWMADEDGNAARCQDAVCYAQKADAWVDAEIAKIKRSGGKVLEVSSKWYIPDYWDVAEAKDRKHPQAYVYEQDGFRRLAWGIVKKAPATASAAMTAEEREAAKAVKRRARFAKSAREKVRAYVAAMVKRTPDDGALRRWAGDRFGDLAARRLERELRRGWFADDLVDDLARTWPEWKGACGMTVDESDALVEEIKAADERKAQTQTSEAARG